MNATPANPAARIDRRVLLALILLSLVPVAAGFVRIFTLSGAVAAGPENARFFASPVPVLLHVVGATVFCLLGAFQFAPGFRAARPRWHRIAGRVLVPAGLIAALSGLWMTRTYPAAPEDGPWLDEMRYAVGAAMVLSLLLGSCAIFKRDIGAHQRWMIRGYALGMGAGTQVITNLPWLLLFGTPRGLVRDGLMLAGWVINLAVAEWLIRRRVLDTIRPGASRVIERSDAQPEPVNAPGDSAGEIQINFSVLFFGVPSFPERERFADNSRSVSENRSNFYG